MTHILHIDTSGPRSTLALAANGVPVAVRQHNGERDHAAMINQLVAAVLEEGNISLAGISAVAVCGGPGSYTGLRVGLSTAKGYCYAAGKPLIMHNRLVLLAGYAQRQCMDASLFVGLLPARAGEYFIYAMNREQQEIIIPGHMVTGDVIHFLSGYNPAEIVIAGSYGPDLALFLEQQLAIRYVQEVINVDYWVEQTYLTFMEEKFFPLTAEPFYLKKVFISNKL